MLEILWRLAERDQGCTVNETRNVFKDSEGGDIVVVFAF
jgi:hypothetical protein